jgi:hypothetical protein
MNKIRKPAVSVLVSLLYILFCATIIPTANVRETVTIDFKDVESTVIQKIKQYGDSNLLVVLDIDNTILTSTVDLGGDIWYQWQNGELNIKPSEDQKVKCLYNDAIGLLYELGTMELTDVQIPEYIQEWQQQGATVFALTSRDPRTRTATERELIKNGIDFSKTALRPLGKDIPVYRYNLKREMSYMKGIMMTSGMNKGVMLNHLLDTTGRSFKAIVFVDDSKKNIEAVKNQFMNDNNIDLTLIRYDKIIEERKRVNGGVVLTQEQTEKMSADWKELNFTLNKIFPGRNKNGGCVSPY